MCDDVVIHGSEKRTASTQVGLTTLLGGFVKDCNYCSAAYQPDMCLCPVDLYKTAEKYGYEATRINPETEEYDPFNVHFIRRASHEKA